VDLKTILEIPEKIKEKKPPKEPLSISAEPAIKIAEKEIEWGKEIAEKIKKELDGLYESITVTDVNRIYLKTKPENLPLIANRIKDRFDHVKSVNVIDIPHENKFIVEYVVSSYSVKELMPVLLTLATEVQRDDPKVPSLVWYWPSADYQEREMQDLFGVVFEGNQWKHSFLLAPEVKHPLRKDFKIKKNVYVLEVSE
jgi:NADH-quinone oxidoreductase subunit B